MSLKIECDGLKAKFTEDVELQEKKIEWFKELKECKTIEEFRSRLNHLHDYVHKLGFDHIYAWNVLNQMLFKFYERVSISLYILIFA